MILFICFLLFQLIPFSPRTLKTISPSTYSLYKELLPGYDTGASFNKAASGLESDPNSKEFLYSSMEQKRAISVYPHATREYLFKIIAYLGTFLLIVYSVRTKTQIKSLLYIIVFVGFTLAVLGIIQKYAWNGKMLWLWKPVQVSGPTGFGPYVNRNHFAGFMNLMIPLAVMLIISKSEKVRERAKNEVKKMKDYFDIERRAMLFFLIFMTVIMIVALFLSLSRGGVLSFAGAFIFLGFMMSKRKRGRRRANTIIAVSLLVGLLTWFGWDPIIHRLETLKYVAQNPAATVRVKVWSDTVEMFKDYPVSGTGIGTYANISHKFKSFKDDHLVGFAHNDYLQMLAEGGIIGIGIVVVSSVLFLSWIISRWKKRHDRFVVYVTLGCLAGIIGLLLSSITTFNFHLPANAFLFAVICALSFSLINTASRNRENRVESEKESLASHNLTRFLFCPLMIVVLLVLSLKVVNILTAEVHLSHAKKLLKSNSVTYGREFAFLDRAIESDATNAAYRYEKAFQSLSWARKGYDNKSRRWALLARNNILEAINLEPTNGYYWVALGWMAGFLMEDHRMARLSYQNSVKLDPMNYAFHRQFAVWAFGMASDISGSNPARDNDPYLEIAVREFRTAVALKPTLVREALWRYSEFTLDPDKLEEIIPHEGDYNRLIMEAITARIKDENDK